MRRIVLTVLCPKQLHVSQYNTPWWHIFKPLKPDQGLDKLPTTQSLIRTHPSLTGPGIAILCIKCNYHWLCVLTLVIFGTIAQLDELFRLQEHMREHLLHCHPSVNGSYMTWLTSRNEATQRCVVSHTQSMWEFVHFLIRFQLFEEMPP